jgi:phage/plasmid-like protein (TIGR03299 family)
MPHEIDLSTGSAAVFVAGAPPWHGLGRIVAEAVRSDEALQLAGLDWLVRQQPLFTSGPDGSTREIATHRVNVRDDSGAVLGVVSRRYQPIQNHEAFAFADAVVGQKLARYETAGALRGGQRVWMLLRLPEPLRAGPDDQLDPFLLLYNTHDGSSALRAVLTTVRVVCQNTLNLALRGRAGEGVTIRHRGELAGRVEQARATLALASRRLQRFGSEVERMVRTPMTTSAMRAYFGLVVRPPPSDADERAYESRQRVLEQLEANLERPTNTLPGMRGSLWAAVNAATELADHQRRYRGRSEQQRREHRLDSVWFGDAARLKRLAWDAALVAMGN